MELLCYHVNDRLFLAGNAGSQTERSVCLRTDRVSNNITDQVGSISTYSSDATLLV